jgi:hypothetical protein
MNNLLSQALGENCIIKLSPYKVEGAKTNTPLKTNTLYMPPNRQHSIPWTVPYGVGVASLCSH